MPGQTGWQQVARLDERLAQEAETTDSLTAFVCCGQPIAHFGEGRLTVADGRERDTADVTDGRR